MGRNPECVLNSGMDREKTLCLRSRLEMTHLAFSLRGVLMGHLGPVVLVPPCSMDSR